MYLTVTRHTRTAMLLSVGWLEERDLLPPSLLLRNNGDYRVYTLGNVIILLASVYGCVYAIARIEGHNLEKIRQLADEAMRANESKTLFLATMSHEVRTRLAVLSAKRETVCTFLRCEPLAPISALGCAVTAPIDVLWRQHAAD